jgi:DNA-binding transcriptional LysR family regulator
MIAVRIGEEIRGMVVAAPDYLARHKRPTTPRDIGAHNCIRFRFPSGVIIPWQSEKKGEQVEVAVEGRLTVNDPELAIRAARDGVGVLYTALGYAAPEIKAGRLVPLLEDWRTYSAAIFLYHPSRQQVPVPLQAFIEFLRENLRARLRRDAARYTGSGGSFSGPGVWPLLTRHCRQPFVASGPLSSFEQSFPPKDGRAESCP